MTSGSTEPPEVLDHQALLRALRAVRRGDFSVRLPEGAPGVGGQIAATFNEIVDLNQTTAAELKRITRIVGRDGQFRQRAVIGPASGGWAGNVEAINQLITDLTEPPVETSRVLGAVARGDLSQRVALEFEGRPLRGEFRRSGQRVRISIFQRREIALRELKAGQRYLRAIGEIAERRNDDDGRVARNQQLNGRS